jgi:predicted Zn-dependent protease
VKERILKTLRDLRKYALKKGCEFSIYYQEENSHLMRFANSAISLNTNEHLIRLDITAQDGRKRASYGLITNLEQVGDMKKGIDIAAEMVVHAMPLNYDPTMPTFAESFADESGFDPALPAMSNAEKLAYFNAAVKGLETDDVKLSGIFSCGDNIVAQINTRSEHTQYFRTSDAQVTIVLAHAKLKWEVQSEQSAHTKAALDPDAAHQDLAFLLDRYQHDAPVQLPLGTYDIVFGSAATADLLNIMNWIGYSGGSMKRGFSFLAEDKVGQKVFSDKFTLVDDPTRLETFPFKRDFTGMNREKPYPLFTDGVFNGFVWFQDDADEFGAKPTGHTVGHRSISLHGGGKDVSSLEALVAQPRERDILYVPFLHYMNIVNPSKGVVTASSRFGALLLKKDGTVAVPYNVRLTQSLLDVFGDKVAWLSKQTVAYNTSASYGARNPTAVIVPLFMRVNGLEISHSNSSY